MVPIVPVPTAVATGAIGTKSLSSKTGTRTGSRDSLNQYYIATLLGTRSDGLWGCCVAFEQDPSIGAIFDGEHNYIRMQLFMGKHPSELVVR